MMLPNLTDIYSNLGTLSIGILLGLILSFIFTWWIRIIVIIALIVVILGYVSVSGAIGNWLTGMGLIVHV